MERCHAKVRGYKIFYKNLSLIEPLFVCVCVCIILCKNDIYDVTILFPNLEIRCPEPVLAEHGILSVTGNDRMYGRTLIRTGTAENSNTGATSYRIGALAKYRCERGYKVVGEPLSTCEDNGKWSGEVPQCVCKIR